MHDQQQPLNFSLTANNNGTFTIDVNGNPGELVQMLRRAMAHNNEIAGIVSSAFMMFSVYKGVSAEQIAVHHGVVSEMIKQQKQGKPPSMPGF